MSHYHDIYKSHFQKNQIIMDRSDSALDFINCKGTELIFMKCKLTIHNGMVVAAGIINQTVVYEQVILSKNYK